jgi:serine/threonine-protein kinase
MVLVHVKEWLNKGSEGMADLYSPRPQYLVEGDDSDYTLGPTLDPRKPAPAQSAKAVEHSVADSIGSVEREPEGNTSGLLGAMLNSAPAEARQLIPVPPAAFPVPHWDRYEFLGVLGRGGMGSVYKARDRRILRIVALKFISGGSQRLEQRFLQEARTQARIDHPGICKVLEVGEVEGKAYIALQYIDGPSLHKAKGQISLRDKIQVIQKTAQALHAAHELGIIHRDIKPANIMLEQRSDGSYHPVLMDFGLARDVNTSTAFTESGAVMGTPWYMSPEQTRGQTKTMDRRTDIYSLGATLYDIVAGRPPFDSETSVDALIAGVLKEPQSLDELVPTIPKALAVIVSKCLNKEPAQRYATAKDLADDLGRLLGNQRIVARKLSLLYRLRWRARHNKPAAATATALLASLFALFAYGIHTRIQTLQKERRAQEQAELARRLGQAVGHLEWLARLAYGMPLHDTRYELGLIRKRMSEIDHDMRSYGEMGSGIGHYALGRGHLALHEWPQAYQHLIKAQAGGLKDLELDYALGRVLGALYSDGLLAARKSGDQSFFLQRQKELTQEFLVPALAHLKRSRRLETVSASYVEGLIDYYNQHYDAALLHAQMAHRQAPWEYEADQLAGDVYLARALSQRDHGDYEQAEQNFHEALRNYEQASAMGRSDYQIYESIAEVVIRQMEMDGLRGQNPRKRLNQALLAADQAIEANPVVSNGYAKKAFAYLFVAQQMESQGLSEEKKSVIDELVSSGERAVAVQPNDEYAHDALGNGYIYLAQYASEHRANSVNYLATARKHLVLATALNPRFPWAYNDLGRSFLVEGDDRLARFQDPEIAYLHSIEAFSNSIAIDQNDQFVYANIALAYSSLARHKFEIGQNPSAHIDQSVNFAKKALAMNNKYVPARGIQIFSYIMKTAYEFDAAKDLSDTAAKTLKLIDELIGIQPNIPTPYQHRSIVYYFITSQMRRNGKDPSSAIQRGLSAVETCQRLSQGADGTCASLEALLFVLAGEWQQQQRQSSGAAVAKALASARLALERAPVDNDVLLAVAEARWRAARIRITERKKVAQEIAGGLAVIDQVLTLAPNWPRALAIRGGLHALRARTATNETERQESVQRARMALLRAAKGNPLLSNTYGEAFRDLRSLSRSPDIAIPLGTGNAAAVLPH